MTLNSSGSVKGFTLIWMVPQHCFPDSETINSGSYDPSLGMKRVPIHCRRVQNTGTKIHVLHLYTGGHDNERQSIECAHWYNILCFM